MKCKLLGMVLVLVASQATFAQDAEPGREHSIPLFLATDAPQQGFIRIVNNSDRQGEVKIYGVDDAGMRFGPVTLSLQGMQTMHLNSGDLENGNADKQLSGALGDGAGNWRLLLYSSLDVEPLAYMRVEGFLNSMHHQVRETSRRWRVSIFNPGDNPNQVSRLRLINPGGAAANITIAGRDDAGRPAPGGQVSLSLEANRAMEISAQELQGGASGLTGSLGDGAGKWQLSIAADRPIYAMSLMESAGLLSNLSAGRRAYRGATNTWTLSFGDSASAGYAILAPDSKLHAWLPESGDLTRVASGAYTTPEPGKIAASGKAYEHGEVSLGATGISGGSEDIRFSNLSYRSGDWIRGEYSVAGGAARAFTGTAFTGFDRGSGVAQLRGEWNTDEGVTPPISLSIDNDEGSFSGNLEVSSFSCDYRGQFSAMNPGFDLYGGSATVTCGPLINLPGVPIVLGIRDAESKPGGGDIGILLLVLPEEEVAFGAILSRG